MSGVEWASLTGILYTQWGWSCSDHDLGVRSPKQSGPRLDLMSESGVSPPLFRYFLPWAVLPLKPNRKVSLVAALIN